jgi:transcriptional regulator with XRE-family HTH domain
VNIQLGKKIKDLRAAKNMTQADMAKRIGMTTSAVSSYEVSERQPSYDVLVKIATLFNVTTDYLLGVGNKDIIDITGLGVKQRTIVNDMINTFMEVNHHRGADTQLSLFNTGVGKND